LASLSPRSNSSLTGNVGALGTQCRSLVIQIPIPPPAAQDSSFNPTLVRFCRLPIRYSSPKHRGGREVRGSVWVLSATGVCWIPPR
jgi:hypothetical protein